MSDDNVTAAKPEMSPAMREFQDFVSKDLRRAMKGWPGLMHAYELTPQEGGVAMYVELTRATALVLFGVGIEPATVEGLLQRTYDDLKKNHTARGAARRWLP